MVSAHLIFGSVVAAALFVALTISLMRRFAARAFAIDQPTERSSHTRPTPRGGGLAIVIAVIVGLVFLAPTTIPRFTLLAAAGVALVGWIDDHRSISTTIRLGVQSVAAIIAMVECGVIQQLPFGGSGGMALSPITSTIITFLWIVGLTNAYNFMDGIDGMAGLQGVVAGLSWTAGGFYTNQPLPAYCGALVAGSCLGFLFHNWHPARIFLGDVGSAFLGYILAVLPLIWRQEARVAFAFGILVLWPFVFDTTLTLLRRARARQPLFRAHRSHLYQRLVTSGLPHHSVTILYGSLAASGGILAVLWLVRPDVGSIMAPIGVAGLALGLSFCVVIAERRAIQKR